MKFITINGIHDSPTKHRFFDKVSSMQTGECWNWTGAIRSSEYGEFWYLNTMHYAHRISWEIYYGYIPEGMLVLHKCDNKRCINPDHLYLGSYSDNLYDRHKRFPLSGKGHNNSKFTGNEAELMKVLHHQKHNYTQIAKVFNTTRQTVSNIVNGRTTNWRLN